MPSPTVLVNGVNLSWPNITCIIGGTPVVGIKEINYKRKQGKVNNNGIGSEPISRGYGMTDYDASITLYYDEIKRIAASAPNGDITKIPPFTMIILFDGVAVPYSKEVISNCEFTEDSFSSKTGDTSITVTLPLIIAGIERF